MIMRVLIVDDEGPIPQGIMDYLEDSGGFDIRLAASGEEGLSLLEGFSPHVCIVDMRLPGMDGNEFITAAHTALPKTKFIIHTGSLEYMLPERLREIGITDKMVLKKPVMDMKIFEDLLHELAGNEGDA